MGKTDHPDSGRELSLFKRFYDTVSDVIFFYDIPQCRLTEANKAFFDFTGYRPEEVVGRSLRDLLRPDSLAGLDASLEKIRIEGSFSGVLHMLAKDGTTHELEYTNTAIGSDDQLRGIVVVAWDPSRKHLVRTIGRYEQEKKTLMDTLPVALFTVDPDKKITTWNKEAERITGFTADEVIGKPCSTFVIPSCGTNCGFLDPGTEKPFVNTECTIRDKHGNEKIISKNSALTRDPAGSATGCIESFIDITKQKRVEQHLKRSTERFKILFSFAPDAYFLFDLKGNIVNGNLAARGMFGYTKEELRGSTIFNFGFLLPEEEDRARTIFERVLQGLPTGPDELTLTRKDGTKFNAEISTYPVKIDDQDLVLAIAHDISERKRAEGLIKESERKWLNFIETSQDVIFITTTDGKFLDINPAGEKVLGFTKEEFFALDVRDLYGDPDDRKRFQDIIKKQGFVKDFEVTFRRKDGTLFDSLMSANVRKESDGTILGYQGIVKDITERRWAEESVRESEEKWRNLFESSKDVVFFSTPEGRLLEMNAVGEELFGYSMEELFTINIRDLYAVRKERETFKDRMQEHGFVKDFEVTFRRKDGSHVDCLLTGTTKRGPDGSIEWYQGNIRDISEITKKQAELEKMKQMAEEANRAKSEFLANMSHEIRTPMNGILGFAELLLEEDLTAEQEENVKTIYQSGQTLLALINDILDLSKIESGRMVVNHEEFDLHELLGDTLMITRPRAQAKGLVLNLAIETTPRLKIISDPDKIRHIVTNLVGNAIKFTDCGRIDVSVGIMIRGKQSGNMTVSVTDTGCGIPPGKLDLIFDPFMQADASTTRKYGGTGLGLSITKKLVDLMDGTITVSSEEGKGSTFRFSLPIRLPGAAGDERKMAGAQKVLIVEDDPLTLKLYRGFLERNDFHVISTKLGQDALPLALEHDPAIIILDIILPDISGWEVLHKLKAHEKTKRIPVIVVSVLSEKERAISLGAVDYIEKPVAGHTLIRKIELLVKSGEERGEKKIVVIDGDEALLAPLKEMLDEKGFFTAAFSTPKDAVAYLKKESAGDVIALMIFLEDLTGFNFVTLLKHEPYLARIPIIFITDREITPKEIQHLEGISYSLLEKSDLISPTAFTEIDKSIKEAKHGPKKAGDVTMERHREPRGGRILLVEDNEINQKLIMKILSKEDYNVTIAENGAVALKTLEGNDFDLILMDIQMPVMDGYAATERIKSDETKRKIPVIALTAHAMKGYEEKVYEAGFDGYLKKPIKKEELLGEIAARLKRGRDERTVAEEPPKDLHEQVEFPEDELKEIYREFDLSLPRKHDVLMGAISRNNYDDIYRVGHDLKGTGGAFGREKISMLGRQIENAAKEKRDDVLSFLVSSLKEEIESIQKEHQ